MVVTDVTCAYVDASMPKDNPEKVVFLRVDALVAPMAQYVTQSGTIMVELDRALYGCIESARLWFDELLSTLKSIVFFANDCDPCIMTRCSEGVRTTVVIYTDDHLISSRKLLHMEFLHWTKM